MKLIQIVLFCIFKSYCVVNKEFASKTVGALENLSTVETDSGTPLVWLHDYHLMLAANSIRNVNFNITYYMDK